MLEDKIKKQEPESTRVNLLNLCHEVKITSEKNETNYEI